MASTSPAWLGHASCRLDPQGGERVYVDPWLGSLLAGTPEALREPAPDVEVMAAGI